MKYTKPLTTFNTNSCRMIYWLSKQYANPKNEIFSVYFVTRKCQKFRKRKCTRERADKFGSAQVINGAVDGSLLQFDLAGDAFCLLFFWQR